MSLANAIMDVILMGLLIAALWFGVRLHGQLKALRAGQEAFAKVVHELDIAAIRAHESLKELRKDADESQDLLHGRIMAARDLMQKLETNVARAERVQRDLDSGVSSAMTAIAMAPSGSQARYLPQNGSSRSAGEEGARPVVAPAPQPAPRAAESFVRRRPFDRDVVREDAPLELNTRSRLPEPAPEMTEDDESELIDKVHMSELVVANLNEMIRSLNLPTRRPLSVEEDLFGGDGPKK